MSFNTSVARWALAGALIAGMPGMAWAQPAAPAPEPSSTPTATSAPAEEPEEDKDAIVVTGTLIRGVAPAGSNTLAVTAEDAKLSGVIDSNALLTTIVPQSESFMDIGNLQPGRGGANALGLPRVPVVRPSLRNLGDSFMGSGSPTLVLLDGSRIVPAGIEQSVVDVGIMPPGIMERTEIILDGTSAVYGSDAVGGTINYIPRKRFDDTRVAATYGFGDDYYAVSADVSTGVTWDGGGLGIAYSFGKNDEILQRERDYAIPRNWLEGGRLTGLACEGYGHISVGSGASTRRFLSTTLAERTDWCNLGYETLAQALERHSVFATFSQDITDSITFDLSAFYSQRVSQANNGPFTTSIVVPTNNPYFKPIPGVAGAQTVAFQWGPIFGNDAALSETLLRVGQITPKVTFKLGGDWQIRVMGAYGKSKSSVDQTLIDTTLVTTLVRGTTFATAINPYDIAATQNKALFGNLIWSNERDGVHTFYQARVVADGPIFSIGGGEVRAAIGAEWDKTDFKRRITDPTTHILGPYNSASASNKSVFGELNVPLVSEQNAIPGIASFTLSASARYDHYASFGGTFNPKFAATYEPVTWATVRGNWGKSFRAPNAVDKLGSDANVLGCSGTAVGGCTNNAVGMPNATSPIQPIVPGLPRAGEDVLIFLSGTNPDLKPETSTNWAIGGDLRPPFIPGLTLSATYWHIKFKNGISFPPIDLNQLILGAPHLLAFNPTYFSGTGLTQAEFDAAVADIASRAPNGQNILTTVAAGNANVLYVRDNSITNLALRKVAGLDANARYIRDTSFGSIDAVFNGTWKLKQETQLLPGSLVTSDIRVGTPTFTALFGVGATIGDFRAQVNMQHRSGFDVDPAANRDPNQTHIPSYQIFNASFRYNINGSHALTKDVVLTAVINNVFNNAPPVNRTTNGSTINGTTFGRVITFGLEKAF